MQRQGPVALDQLEAELRNAGIEVHALGLREDAEGLEVHTYDEHGERRRCPSRRWRW